MADDSLFLVQLVTPERILLDGVASEVILRTDEGDITFLTGTAPLVGTVEPGVVRVTGPEGVVERIAVHGGFVQVEQHVEADEVATSGTRITILAAVAERSEELDVARAGVARDSAEAKISELGGSRTGEGDEIDPELVDAQAALVRAEVRLEAAESSSVA